MSQTEAMSSSANGQYPTGDPPPACAMTNAYDTQVTGTEDEHPPSPSPSLSVPVPWRQYLPVLAFSIAHALSYAVIFPFVSDVITSFGVPSNRIGLYVGVAEGIMMLVEAAAAPTWARLADKYGRRPTLLVGFSICVLACPMLSFSSSVWELMLWRACIGLNSSAVLVTLMAAELSHPSNRSQMFSLLSPTFNVGMVLGTCLGGQLAHPFGRLPSFLGGTSQFWLRHPYALPCVAIGSIDTLTVLFGLFYITETRKTLPSRADTSRCEPDGRSTKGNFSAAIRVPGFLTVVTVSMLYQLSTFSWDGMYAVYVYTQPAQGGLGLSVDIIGLLYATNYFMSFVMSPVFLPRILRRWGSIRSLGMVLTMWPILALLVPLEQWTAIHARHAMWGVLLFQLGVIRIGAMAWPMCDILIMSCFDDYPDLIATGSAIGLMSGTGGRALGPALSGWLFSLSTQYSAGSVLRQMSWVYLILVTVPPVLLTRFMRRDKAGSAGEREALLGMDRGGDLEERA